ncbi:MAG TPA: DUF29 domain-containing protein [Acetobacteraceae bacterium]|nr:DUF29 domain-containing protein [Acetobacteraceae bacterium]
MDQGYDTDLALWAEDQARALRDAGHAGTNLPIDWENVAEEIESLGKSQGRELASRIAVILLHLIKLEASPADAPRIGWQETVAQQRGDIERVLADSPSLRPAIPMMIDKELGRAKRVAALALADYGEQPRVDLGGLRYTAEQVLGDWFPDNT